MKAEDLRIKNYITLNEKQRQDLHDDQINARNEFFIVKTIYSDGDIAITTDDEIIDISESLVDPILLTEEWLLKFGFEEVDYAGGCYNLGIVCIDTSDFNCVVNGKWLDVKIQYVHQLQNLYYALTQTELQLTEK